MRTSQETQFDREACVLSAALLEVPLLVQVVETLTARDFTDDRHQVILAALRTVKPAGNRTDFPQVMAAVRDLGGGDRVISHLGFLVDYIPTSDPFPNWMTALLEETRRRATASALELAMAEVAKGEALADVEHSLDQRLARIRASAPEARVFDDKGEMATGALEYLNPASNTGTPYGFAPLDRAVLPVELGHLILIGGASGSGKSTVARNVLRSYVQRYKKPVGLLTCEMTGAEQLAHLACMDAQVSIESLVRRQLNPIQRQLYHDCVLDWQGTDLLAINEMGALTPAVALRILRRWRANGFTHFFLDHLHRLDYGATKSGDDLRLPIAAFARELKTFAKDTQSVVVALVQYSKIRTSEEPGDEKIREANNILEECDAAFHIFRPHIAHTITAGGDAIPLRRDVSDRPYFEHDLDAPKGSTFGPDRDAVYVKLGKQRRRLRDGIVRVPFNSLCALMYDAPHGTASSYAPAAAAS